MSECVEVEFFGNQMEKVLHRIAKRIVETEDIGNDCNSHRTVIMVAQDVYGANFEQARRIYEIIKNEYLK